MAKKKFKTVDEALKWCFDRVKPSKMDKDLYNRFNVYRHRHNNPETKLKSNAIDTILDHFGVQQICTYEVEVDEQKEPLKKSSSSRKTSKKNNK